MSTVRMPFARRAILSGRGALVALVAGAGMAIAPLPAVTSSASAAVAAAPTHSAAVAVNTALAQQGKPYAYGAAGPSAFDCSGLVNYAFKKAGKSLPRTARALATVGTPVSKGNLRPGDLVFFYGASHVAIYVGNGNVVHASTYGKPVKVIPMQYMPFYTARRI
jgi:cell wall-associated NlpC family hydrolase